ncbi:MAG: MBL fold metallo-hydrolase [Methyloceanibacter sp.]|uniref:MBL fold metallo-hydrolase n=1 Tax=Methyloceanibacter sp. TaxID=1965321 RepID=UPI003D6D8058
MSRTKPPSLKVKPLNDHLIAFYAGRDEAPRLDAGHNWYDDGAMNLGVCTYAIHDGDRAVIYDTFASVPMAEFGRAYLKDMGIRKITVVLSHWHLDHIAGNEVFDDCDIIATMRTRDAMMRHKTEIEAGRVWGPPPIAPLVFPNIMFEDRLELSVGGIALELRRMNIHSIDGCVIYLPRDKLLLAGDTVEDSLTWMIEPENLAEHIRDLREMQSWDVAKILPAHGDPDVIFAGGYDTTLIDATIAYVGKMLSRAHDADFMDGTMEDYIAPEVAKGWVHSFEPYRAVHAQNLKVVRDYWQDKALPDIAA